MNKEHIQRSIMNYIKEEFRLNEDAHLLTTDCNLFEEGYVDSLEINKLIAFLEGEFGVEIEDDYFLDDRFVSITGQADIILELRANAQIRLQGSSS